MKKYIFIFLSCLCTFCYGQSPSCPLHYVFETTLSSNADSSFKFHFIQKLDLTCEILAISPIDQSPETIKITFNQIQAQSTLNDKEFSFDTKNVDPSSIEFQSIKKLLHHPFTLTLNRDMTIQRPAESFLQLLHLSLMEKQFINEDLLDQITQSIFTPSKIEKDKSSYVQAVYFPFKTKTELAFNLKESHQNASFLVDQPLNMEGLYSTVDTPFSIFLTGRLKSNGKWHKKKPYVNIFSVQYNLKEDKKETLFDSPLDFNYTTHLQLFSHDK